MVVLDRLFHNIPQVNALKVTDFHIVGVWQISDRTQGVLPTCRPTTSNVFETTSAKQVYRDA